MLSITKNAKVKPFDQKWSDFLDNDPIGQRGKACVARENPIWTMDQTVDEISCSFFIIYYGDSNIFDKMFNRNAIIYSDVGQPQKNENHLSVMNFIAAVADSLKENEIQPLPEDLYDL